MIGLDPMIYNQQYLIQQQQQLHHLQHSQHYQMINSSVNNSMNLRGDISSQSTKKQRFVWPDELHKDFIIAVFEFGLNNIHPTDIIASIPSIKSALTNQSSSYSNLYKASADDYIYSHLLKFKTFRQNNKSFHYNAIGNAAANTSSVSSIAIAKINSKSNSSQSSQSLASSVSKTSSKQTITSRHNIQLDDITDELSAEDIEQKRKELEQQKQRLIETNKSIISYKSRCQNLLSLLNVQSNFLHKYDYFIC